MPAISQLPALTLTGSEYVPAQQGVVTGAATTAQIANVVDPLYYQNCCMPRATANNTGVDLSSNAATVTNVGLTTTNINSKQDAYCWQGTGSGAYATINTPQYATSLLGDFTVACWLNPASIAVYNRFLSAGLSGNFAWFFGFSPSSGGEFDFYDGTNELVGGAGLFTAGVWQHVAAVRKSGVLRFFMNGVCVTSQAYTATPGGTSAGMVIGGRYTGSTMGETLNGSLAGIEFRQYAKYVANFAPPTLPFASIV